MTADDDAPGPGQHEWQLQRVDAVYRALGRLIVCFSQLEHTIEVAMVCTVSADPNVVWTLIAGERGPEAMRSWVTLHKLWGGRSAELARYIDPKPVLAALNTEVRELIEARNATVHAASFVGGDNIVTDIDWHMGHAVRVRPGGEMRRADLEPESLDRLADQCLSCGDAIARVTSLLSFAELDIAEAPPIFLLQVGPDRRVRPPQG